MTFGRTDYYWLGMTGFFTTLMYFAWGGTAALIYFSIVFFVYCIAKFLCRLEG